MTEWVRSELAARIASEAIRPGDQLPTERELCVEFGVSRVTVRRALAQLAEERQIYSVRGRGTFVSTAILGEPPNTLLSFHDLVGREGVSVGASVLESEVRSATWEQAEEFGIAPGSPLFFLSRLRTLDDLPVAIDDTLLPLSLAPEMPDLDWGEASLYETLRAAGHTPHHAEYTVGARGATPSEVGPLRVEVGFAVLAASSLTRDESGRLLVSGLITYRGDRYRFRSTQVAGTEPLGPTPAREALAHRGRPVG
ncbi:GntR family transcriptional regulator [Oryzobacter telluris]|uniref:GntR family transcriptional regulator n=1 Tax=Oryzobacter telluris TaxID=3149179 RepID=UPI00370D7A79